MSREKVFHWFVWYLEVGMFFKRLFDHFVFTRFNPLGLSWHNILLRLRSWEIPLAKPEKLPKFPDRMNLFPEATGVTKLFYERND